MNSAVVVAFAAVLAVANAGYLAAPAIAYSQLSSQAGLGVSHDSGIIRGAPLIAAYPAHHSLIRIARGILAHAPLTTYSAGPIAHPAAYGYAQLSSQAGLGVSHDSGIVRGAPLIAAHHSLVRIARGLIAGAPLAYAAAPALIAAPTVSRTYHGAGIGSTSPVVFGGLPHIRVARGLLAHQAPLTTYSAGPVLHSAPLALAHAAPLAYAAHPAALAYSGVPAIHAGHVLLK